MADANPFDQFDAKPIAATAAPPGGPSGNPFDLFDVGQDAKPAAQLSPAERDKMIRVVIGEAGAEPYEGKAAVAHVILNRAKANSREFGGGTVDQVIEKPNAFEPWTNRATRAALERESPTSKKYQQAAQIVDAVLAGQVADPTKGATFFYSPSAQAAMIAKGSKRSAVPVFATPEAETAKIGRHVFYAPSGQPVAPQAVAAAPMEPAGPAIAPTAPVEAPAGPVAPKTASMVPGMPGAAGSMLEKAAEPITSLPETYQGMIKESTGQMAKGVEQFQGGEKMLGALNALAGAIGYTLAPINAPIRSIIGKPVEEATGIPKEYTEFAAQLAVPGAGLAKLPGAAAKATPKAAAKVAKPATEALAPVPEGTPLKTVVDEVKTAAANEVPTTEKLRTLSQRLYAEADKNDIVISSAAGEKIIAEAFKRITRRTPGENSGGFSPSVQKESFGALKELYQAVTSDSKVALQAIEDKRSILAEVARSPDKRERRVAGMILEELEKGLANLKQSDVVAGDVSQVKDLLETRAVARELWDRHLKSETIDKLWRSIELTKGKFVGSGLENAIRTKFRQFALNEEEMRRFSPAEREAIESLTTAKGAAYIAQIAGKLSPVSFLGLISAIGSFTVKGPAGLAVPAIGLAGRAVANALTKREVQQFRELVRTGGRRAPDELPPASRAELPTRSMFQAGLPVGRGLPAVEE